MAGLNFSATTAAITVNGTDQKAMGINAAVAGRTGFLVHRVIVSFDDRSSETGNCLVSVHKSDGAAAAGTALTEIITDGGADTLVAAAFGPYITAASEGRVEAKYWPVTSQASCIFTFTSIKPFKVVAGKGMIVDVDTRPMSATAASTFTVTVEGEE